MLQITSPNELPDVAPRSRVLLHDPVAFYIDGLGAPSSRTEMRRQLLRVARLVGYPSTEAVPWENLRLPHYAGIRRKLLDYRPDPEGEPDRGLAPSSVNLALAALRGVAGAVWELGYMTAEEHARIQKGVKPARGARLPAGRAAKRGEIAALMHACEGDPSYSGVRDAAMIALAYSTGIRRAEVAGLRLVDYRREDGDLRVLGKGDRERLVPVAGGAAAALADWLVVRGTEPGPLFAPINKGGRIGEGPLSEHAVYKMLAKRASQAGLSEKLTPHDLRHSFITDLYRGKVATPVIQALAGHANPATTMMYDRSGEEDRREAVEILHVPYERRYPAR